MSAAYFDQPRSTSAWVAARLACAAWAMSASSTQDVALAFGSFAVASAIFLIFELNQPFSGLFVVTSQIAQADLIRSKRRAEGPLRCWANGPAEQR